MEVMVERGAGMDVHKKSVTVCLLQPAGRTLRPQIRRFSTIHSGLVELKQWLIGERVTHVAMEATGEYWKPIYELFEDDFRVIVANAQHVKNVPGRKTDLEDAAWIAKLLRHGLLSPSFVPPRPIRRLRDKTRTRRKLVQSISRVENRAQKILEISGIKLGSVVSDVFGATGREILAALADGVTDAKTLGRMAKGTLKRKIPQLIVALDGSFTSHHARLLRHQLDLHETMEAQLEQLEAELLQDAAPYGEIVERLDRIPGINTISAIEIIAEIGVDMSHWKESKHIAAWSGLCPGNHESAGRRKQMGVRRGNPFLKAVLTQCATAAVRTEGSFYQARFRTLAKRRGNKRALIAIAHALIIAIYHMIQRGEEYREPDLTLSDQQRMNKQRRLIRQLEAMGLSVNVAPLTATA